MNGQVCDASSGMARPQFGSRCQNDSFKPEVGSTTADAKASSEKEVNYV